VSFRAPCTTTSAWSTCPYYLDEYNFRFNRRASSTRGMLFYRLLQQAIGTDPHPSRTWSAANSPTALTRICRTHV